MIFVSLLLAIQSVPAQPMTERDPIVILGERMKHAGGRLKISPITGKVDCKITKTSGDKVIDDAVCQIALYCAHQSRRKDRLGECIKQRRDEFVIQYIERKRALSAQD